MDLSKDLDLEEVKKTIKLLKNDSELFEVRIISSNKFNNYSGYFKNFETLEPELKKVMLKSKSDNFNAYITLNKIVEENYFKEQKNIFKKSNETTSDDAITDYSWILIDLDPIRRSKISSSYNEKEKAFELLEVLKSNLKASGFGNPLLADSGNGYHLLYKVDFENNEENRDMVQQFLKLLDLMFSTKEVDIDTNVFNPSRITSLYGTLKRKGSNSDERPHRISNILNDNYTKTSLNTIKNFINSFKYIADDDKTIETKKTKFFDINFNLIEWLETNNIPYKHLSKMYKSEWNMYRLEKCYFNEEHDPPTLLEKNGYVKYKCHHKSCAANSFKKMVEKISPDDVKKLKNSKREQTDLDEFHWLNAKDIPTKVIDIRVANYVLKNYFLAMYNGKLYFYDNGVFKIDNDDIKVKEIVKSCMFEEFITSRKISAIVNLIKDDKSIHVTKVNKYESHIINFKNGMLNVLSDELMEHDPKYLSVNQIPHNYVKKGKMEDTIFYKFLESRIPDNDDKKMLFEYMGYCLTTDYSLNKMLFIQGIAYSGKSIILDYIVHLVGEQNSVSKEIQAFSTNRFASSNLLNKLLCFNPDLPETDLEDTGMIKTLTGGDFVSGEYKGGKSFEFKNTAKLLFTCNKVPRAYKEKSNGLYRRYLIIHFSKEGDLVFDLLRKLHNESEVVIYNLVKNLRNVLKRKKIHESNNSINNVRKLRNISDNIQDFLYQNFIDDESEYYIKPEHDHAQKIGFIKKTEIYKRYVDFCENENTNPIGRNKFFESLENNGIEEKRKRVEEDRYRGFEISNIMEKYN